MYHKMALNLCLTATQDPCSISSLIMMITPFLLHFFQKTNLINEEMHCTTNRWRVAYVNSKSHVLVSWLQKEVGVVLSVLLVF